MGRHIEFSVGDCVMIDDVEHVFDGCVAPVGEDALGDDLIFLDRRTRRPTVFALTEFDVLYAAARIRILKSYEKVADVAPEADRADFEKARRRQLWCEAADAACVSRSTKALTAFIAATADQIPDAHPPSAGSLRRWLKDRGFVGDRRSRFMGDRIPRGPREMRIDVVAQRVLAGGMKEYAEKGVRMNQKAVYAKCRAKIIEINLERERNGLHPIVPPSKATVHRYIVQREDEEVMTARFGKRLGGRPFQPILGGMNAKRILDILTIDHTQLDCNVIDDEHRVNVGRPYLTVGLDAASRYPLGFYLGFEPPSVYSAMACLRHCVKPKMFEREAYPDVVGEWVAFGVPNTIVCDNAWEFVGSSFPDACRDANISLVYAGVGDPQYKGVGERFFGTLNELIVHRVQGGLPYTPQKRNEMAFDADRDAVLLLSDLRALIYQAIVDCYGRRPHSTLGAAPEQVWREQATKWGTFYSPDLGALEASLNVVVERTLTNDGIQLHGLTYRSPLELAGLLADMMPGGRRKASLTGPRVKVKYDAGDIGHVQVFNNKRQHYVRLLCTKYDYAKGKSVHYHKELLKWARAKNLAFESEDQMCLASARLQDEIDRLILTSKKTGDRHRAQRLKPQVASPQAVRLTEVQPGDASMIAIGGLDNIGDGTPSRRQQPRKRQDHSRRSGTVRSRVVEAEERNPYAEEFAADAPAEISNPYEDMDFSPGQAAPRDKLSRDAGYGSAP